MEGEVVASSMAGILSNVTVMASTVIDVLGDFVTEVVGTPFLLIGVSLMICGAAVSFVGRLIRL